MAEQKVILAIGSSNMAGFAALLDDVPGGLSDPMTRWIGAGGLHPPLPTPAPAQLPYHVSVAGCRMFTPRLPYSTNISRVIHSPGDGGGGSAVDYDGVAAGAIADSWVYIRVNETGQGNLRKVATDPGGGGAGGSNRMTVTAAFSPALSGSPTGVWGHINFLQDSHTIASIDATRTVIVRTATAAPDFGTEVDGRFVIFFESDEQRRVVSHTADSITLDGAIGGTPAAGGGFCILTGANSVETIADLANPAKCALLDLQFYLDKNAPVYLTGFDYGNYDVGTPFQNPRTAFAGGPTVNCIWELQWQLRSRLGNAPIVIIELGVSSSMVSPFLQGKAFAPANVVAFGNFFSWVHDLQSLDFHPSSPKSLYTALTNAMTCTRLLLAAENNTPNFDTCCINLADNDPSVPDRAPVVGSNFVLLRDALRAFVGSPGMYWIMAGPSRYGGAFKDSMYEQLGAIAEDDLDSVLFDTRGFVFDGSATDDFASDALHFSAFGQIKLGMGFAEHWDEVNQRSSAAARLRAELPSLATIRTKVRRRYERTDAGTSAIPAQIDMFINDSLREIYNTLGDSAWFLRIAEEVAMSTSYPGTLELPRKVRRFLKLERASCPGHSLVVKGLAYTSEGKVQVTLHDYGGGPFIAHFIQNPKELVAETDVALLPVEYVELVVMLTCKRLGENTGNMSLAVYYATETERLWRLLKREAQRYDRMRQGQLTGVGVYDTWRNGGYPGGVESL